MIFYKLKCHFQVDKNSDLLHKHFWLDPTPKCAYMILARSLSLNRCFSSHSYQRKRFTVFLATPPLSITCIQFCCEHACIRWVRENIGTKKFRRSLYHIHEKKMDLISTVNNEIISNISNIFVDACMTYYMHVHCAWCMN